MERRRHGTCPERPLSHVKVEDISWLMPYDNDLNTLIFLAAEAKKEDSWFDFSRFCELRGQGVRAAALEHLDKFAQAAASWSFEKRRAFSHWVLWRSRKFRDDRVVLPHPLREQLIVPTLRMWCDALPSEAEPHLWLGLLRCDNPSIHLDQALKLDPSCDLARRTLTDWILSDVHYNQHELPSGYINDAASDLKELERAAELASGSMSEAWARNVHREIAELRVRAEEAMAAQSCGTNVVPFPGSRLRIFPPDEE